MSDAYTPTIWEDEVPNTSPVKYSITGDSEGEISASAEIAVVSSITAGTPVNAENMNHIEEGISDAHDRLDDLESAVDTGTVLVPSPSTDHQASGVLASLQAAVTMNFGDVGFMNSSGKVALGDADAIATANCLYMCVDEQILANAYGNYMLLGFARNDTWSWTVGGLIYLSTTGTTGNTLTQTPPSGTDDVIQILGVATHADRMHFHPQLSQVEHV